MNQWQFVVFGTAIKNNGVVIQLYSTDAALNTMTPNNENASPGNTFNNGELFQHNCKYIE